MLKHLIPSKAVSAYMEQTGFRFTDAELAVVIWRSAHPLWAKHRFLQQLQAQTADAVLRRQIGERLDYDHKCYRLFAANNGGCFYETVALEDGEVTGHFASFALAVSHAKALSAAFSVRKYQIVGLCTGLIVPQVLGDPRFFGGNAAERLYCGEPVAEFSFDAAGVLQRYWSWETPRAEIEKLEGWGTERFEKRFVRMPNPFEAGDRVRIVGTDRVGVVTTSQTQWRAFLQRVAEGSFAVDYSNAAVTVEFSADSHDHLPPICLDRVGAEQTSPENETERK